MALNLKHLTIAQFVARLREKYRSANADEVGKIASWVLARIAAGDVTDTQLRNAFGMTVTQYNTFKTRLQAHANNWTAVKSATGE
jgi:hypothetical protein